MFKLIDVVKWHLTNVVNDVKYYYYLISFVSLYIMSTISQQLSCGYVSSASAGEGVILTFFGNEQFFLPFLD